MKGHPHSPETRAKMSALKKAWWAQQPPLKACKNGHPRTTENVYLDTRGATQCRICRKDAQARWREKHPERSREQGRRSYHRHARPGDQRDYHLFWKYGLTSEDYERLLAGQGGVCAICQRPPKKNRLRVDHCHTTGAVRGLLCVRCNTCLGWHEKHDEAARSYLAHSHQEAPTVEEA